MVSTHNTQFGLNKLSSMTSGLNQSEGLDGIDQLVGGIDELAEQDTVSDKATQTETVENEPDPESEARMHKPCTHVDKFVFKDKSDTAYLNLRLSTVTSRTKQDSKIPSSQALEIKAVSTMSADSNKNISNIILCQLTFPIEKQRHCRRLKNYRKGNLLEDQGLHLLHGPAPWQLACVVHDNQGEPLVNTTDLPAVCTTHIQGHCPLQPTLLSMGKLHVTHLAHGQHSRHPLHHTLLHLGTPCTGEVHSSLKDPQGWNRHGTHQPTAGIGEPVNHILCDMQEHDTHRPQEPGWPAST